MTERSTRTLGATIVIIPPTKPPSTPKAKPVVNDEPDNNDNNAQVQVLRPGPRQRTARAPDGTVLNVPEGWTLTPPGDATLTRRIKTSGPCWLIQEFKRNKKISLGVWADEARVTKIIADLEAERATESYAKKLAAGRTRRAEAQADYVEDFGAAVLTFLDFHPRYAALAQKLAAAITAHATPVGSGTVARTERIPIEQRAEAATIAWLRHQTTAYDSMSIPLIKGMRREVRQELAQKSRDLLNRYRKGQDTPNCPLTKALGQSCVVER